MRGITHDCAVEMIERKLIWIYVVVTVIAILLIVASKSMSIEVEMNAAPGENPLAGVAQRAAVGAIDTYLWFLVFLTVLGTAGLIPSMLSKGRAEYYLSKPISRTSLYLSKLFGTWAVYGATIVLGGLICYSIFYLAWGYFDSKLVWIFVLNLVNLFVWLSVTTFAGILTGSFAVSIMVAFSVWAAQLMLTFHEGLKQLVSIKIITGAVDGLYYILPKTSQISDLSSTLARGDPVESWLPLWSSLLFAAVLIIVTTVIFKRKDY